MNNFSRFVRNCCLDNPIITVAGIKELTTELNRIGNNLNQIARLSNEGLIVALELPQLICDRFILCFFL